jgi:hypothetical protein
VRLVFTACHVNVCAQYCHVLHAIAEYFVGRPQ